MPNEHSVMKPNKWSTISYTPHLRRSINLAYLENGPLRKRTRTYWHSKRQRNLYTHYNNSGSKDNENKPDLFKTSCLYCKKLGHLIKDCRKRIRKELLQKRDTSQKINGFTPKTYPLVQSVKGQTIHQENVLTVPTPPVDHKKIKQHSSPDDSLTEGT